MSVVEASGIVLRPYQEEATSEVHRAVGRGVRRPLVGLPTGTGKTVVFARVIRDRQDVGPALILAHRDELLDQAADKFMQQQPDAWVGKVKAGANEWNLPVVVGSIQTLHRDQRLQQIPPGFYSTVIVDEAHHATAENTYAKVIDYLDAELTLGVTATPERADGIALGGVWEEIVYHRGMLEMIEQGYLVDIKGVQVKLRRFNTDELKVRRGDFVEGQAGRMLMEADAPAHAAKAYLEHAAGRKTILFTPTVELSKLMAAEFLRQGVPAEHVDGTTPGEERRAILRRFHEGETMVVSNCAVLTEGFDEPGVGCVIVARPTKSKVLYVQMIGRGTRVHPGKEDLIVLDLVGNSDRLDLVTVPKLFGVDAKAAEEEGVAAAKKREADLELGRQLIGETAATAYQAAPGQLESREVDMFGGRKPMHWLRLKDGRWTLSMGTGFVALEQDAAGTWSTRVYQGKKVLELGHRIDLGYAQGMGEDYVRAHGSVQMVDPDAGWRRHPASDTQKRKLLQLGIGHDENITKGAASDLISAALQAKQLRAVS